MSAATKDSASPSQEKPVLLLAINATLKAFEERSRLYRNIVVAVSLMGIVAVACSLIFWRIYPLAAVLLIIPTCVLFLKLDERRVGVWRDEILDLSRTQGLNLTIFRDSMSQLKHLPQTTLRAMLATLPEPPNRRNQGGN